MQRQTPACGVHSVEVLIACPRCQSFVPGCKHKVPTLPLFFAKCECLRSMSLRPPCQGLTQVLSMRRVEICNVFFLKMLKDFMHKLPPTCCTQRSMGSSFRWENFHVSHGSQKSHQGVAPYTDRFPWWFWCQCLKTESCFHLLGVCHHWTTPPCDSFWHMMWWSNEFVFFAFQSFLIIFQLFHSQSCHPLFRWQQSAMTHQFSCSAFQFWSHSVSLLWNQQENSHKSHDGNKLMVKNTQWIMKWISWANVIVKCLHFACSKHADVAMMCWKPEFHGWRVPSLVVVSLQNQRRVPCRFCTRCPAHIPHWPCSDDVHQTWCKGSSCTVFHDSSFSPLHNAKRRSIRLEKPLNFSTWKLAPPPTW